MDRAGEVFDFDGLPSRRSGFLAGDGLGGDDYASVTRYGDVCLVHTGGAVVVGAPWVEIVPVGVEIGLGIEGGGGDDGALGEGRAWGVEEEREEQEEGVGSHIGC